ncbi:tetratricopeptide repeat protein [Aliirhizobium terrae]|uniref:tetratricopeptide repeat protein n=1 Tax=Terrirhizobium terrae TaxID=2926709 RepID=UPI0025765E89|nr:tetratricopeptide repeat protein [Rhizobium sp. CC-CFT758]WJH40190.1 tetratricopeptide repeat protein [Rhizobium sp. CC-CFT758]
MHMVDFAVRFQELKQELDDPDARFLGEGMVDDLLALAPYIPDRQNEAWLFRELAVLEGKRGQLSCLDHADRALAAQADTDILPPDRLYFMHVLCGDVGATWSDDPRTRMHLDKALSLHAQLDRPIGEEFFTRLNLGIYEKSIGSSRMGLDVFEPLLADGEKHHGQHSSELSNLLRLMSESQEALGDFDRALYYGKRSLDLNDYATDPGRRVTALMTFGRLQFRAGRKDDARTSFDEAVAFAEVQCSSSTQDFAREERDKQFPDPLQAPPHSLLSRLKAAFRPR